MSKADFIFKKNIKKILTDGVWSEQARPKYKNGKTANSKYITGAFAEYDLAKGEFPITTLRPIAIKSAIKEVFWIYQDQTNELAILNDKYGVRYWNDWEVKQTGTIGERYGAIVKKHDIMNKILKQLEENPWNRRNVISLWDYEAFEKNRRSPTLCLSNHVRCSSCEWRNLFRCYLNTALQRYAGCSPYQRHAICRFADDDRQTLWLEGW